MTRSQWVGAERAGERGGAQGVGGAAPTRAQTGSIRTHEVSLRGREGFDGLMDDDG